MYALYACVYLCISNFHHQLTRAHAHTHMRAYVYVDWRHFVYICMHTFGAYLHIKAYLYLYRRCCRLTALLSPVYLSHINIYLNIFVPLIFTHPGVAVDWRRRWRRLLPQRLSFIYICMHFLHIHAF